MDLQTAALCREVKSESETLRNGDVCEIRHTCSYTYKEYFVVFINKEPVAYYDKKKLARAFVDGYKHGIE